MKSPCRFRKVVRVNECLPTTTLKVLKSPAEIVQKALIEMRRFAIGVRCPDVAWYCFDDLTELVFTLPQSCLGTFALRQIEHERDAFTAAFFEQRASNQHRHATAIFAEILFLERLKSPG